MRTPKRQLLQIIRGATVKAASVSGTLRDSSMTVITVSVTAATPGPITPSLRPPGPPARAGRRPRAAGGHQYARHHRQRHSCDARSNHDVHDAPRTEGVRCQAVDRIALSAT